MTTLPTAARPQVNTRQIVIWAAGLVSLVASFLPWWSSPHLVTDLNATYYPDTFRNLWHSPTFGLLLVSFGLSLWVAAALAVQQWVRPTGKLATLTSPTAWGTLLVVQALAYAVSLFGAAKGLGFWLGLVATAAMLVAVLAASSIAPLAGHALVTSAPVAAGTFEPYWASVPTQRSVHDLGDGSQVAELTTDDWYLVVAEHATGTLTVQLGDGRQAALHDVTGLVRA